AARGIHHINQSVGAEMPIATAIYRALWENEPAETAFAGIEKVLV
ncbi:MAG: glycerol-3-phosphate dehydrogenase, partial [Dinghuibacter sp.]|nr:glycerol-3-phosphate dehydrogenase [Dinghuibacter sp.]